MSKQSLFLIGLGVSFLFFAGCAEFYPVPSLGEMDYGNSYNLSKQNQILNPGAEQNLEPVKGLDGKAANKAIEKYRKDFEKPTPPPTYVLGVGDIGK
jgi:hypothetical protein